MALDGDGVDVAVSDGDGKDAGCGGEDGGRGDSGVTHIDYLFCFVSICFCFLNRLRRKVYFSKK